nr:hypothetical protein [Tanacetum cinerariifolium]
MSVNTQFCKQSVLGKLPSSFESKLYVVTPFLKYKGLPKIYESHALSKPVTSNSIPKPQESIVVKNEKVIAPRMLRIDSRKTSREDKLVHINKIKASVRINPITVSQPHVLTKKDINSNSNGLSSIEVDKTAKTRRPQLRSNTKNDRVPFVSKSSCFKNKEVEVEEHHRNLLISKNKKHMSSECNTGKLAIRNDKYEVVCALSNDEAPKVIKTFLKKIAVLLHALVIMAEAIATVCYTQKRSIIHFRFGKTPFELINCRKLGCYNDNLALMLSPESDDVIRLEKENSLTSQLETQKTQFVNEIDRLSREYYYADHMNAILGVILTTSVSRPQLKSNPQGDRVMHNNSQGKEKEVEDHRRSVKLSKNKTSITACNDGLNAKTLNVKYVSAMLKKAQEKDKVGSKPDKNGKRGKARKV